MGDDRLDVAEHLLEQLTAAASQIGQLLRRQQQAESGSAGAPEQPRHATGADRRELVDRDQRRHRRPLAARSDAQQVLHDRRGQHPCEQRQAIGLEAEIDDRALTHRGEQVERTSAPSQPRVKPATEL